MFLKHWFYRIRRWWRFANRPHIEFYIELKTACGCSRTFRNVGDHPAREYAVPMLYRNMKVNWQAGDDIGLIYESTPVRKFEYYDVKTEQTKMGDRVTYKYREVQGK